MSWMKWKEVKWEYTPDGIRKGELGWESEKNLEMRHRERRSRRK